MNEIVAAWTRLAMVLLFDVWRYPDAVRGRLLHLRMTVPASTKA